MTTSALELNIPEAVDVTVTDDTLHVELNDGRSLAVMQGITFTLLMEDRWKQELAAAGIGYRPPGN